MIDGRTPPTASRAVRHGPARRAGAAPRPGDMAPPFAYDVAVMRITVAALMTTRLDRAHLERAVPAIRPRS